MSQNRVQLPAFFSSWKSIVGIILIILAVVFFLLGKFDLFQTLIIGTLGVFLI